MAILIAAVAFSASCSSDSDGVNTDPDANGFNFGGNKYGITGTRHTYIGKEDGKSIFLLRFEGRKSAGEALRTVTLYLSSGDDAKQLPAGTYTQGNGCIEAAIYFPAEEGPRLATGGKATVSKEGDTYIIGAEFSFADGYTLKLDYRGSMPYVDDSTEPAENTFRYDGKNYNILHAQQAFLGEYPGSGFPSAFMIKFSDKVPVEDPENPEDLKSNVVALSVLADDKGSKHLPAGSYPLNIRTSPTRAETGECWKLTFLPVSATDPYYAADGRMTVTADGDAYEVKIESWFRSRYKFSLSFKGTMEYTDATIPG